jgi:hypothetical protein
MDNVDTEPAAHRVPRFEWILAVLERQRHAWHEQRELADAVLGTVVSAAAMVAASLHGSLPEIVVSVVVTLLIYWAAERYADLLAGGVHAHDVTWARVGAELCSGWPMLEAASAPVAALLLVALPTGRVQAAVLTAVSVATALLGWLGLLAARRAGYRGWAASVAWVGGSSVLGIVAISLKLLLH